MSYTDLLQTLDERQHSLVQRYAFTCCCPRCLDDSSTPGDWFLDAVAADGELTPLAFVQMDPVTVTRQLLSVAMRLLILTLVCFCLRYNSVTP